MIIYKTTNLVNGKIYIGQDKYNRETYLGSGFKLRRAIKKYGVENFKKEILEHCNSKKEMDDREKIWIKELDAQNDSIGYNIANGGQGGEILDYNQKQKMGVSKKLAKTYKNKHLSEEHKVAISKGMEKYKSKKEKEIKCIHRSGEKNGFYGKKHTGDMKRFGKHAKGRPPTNALKVKRIDTGIVYESCEAASKEFPNPNTARRAISDVCKGRRESFIGIKFEFV